MAMFTRSPALVAARNSSVIDPHHPAEYPVLLGDAFKDGRDSLPTSLSMRFNWKAQKPSTISRMHLGASKSSSDSIYELTIEDQLHKDKPYRYAGHASKKATTAKPKDGDEDPDQALALVWDPAKSAFILEPISAWLDFNLTSAPDQSQREINAHKKLPTPMLKDSETVTDVMTNPMVQDSDPDSDGDASNPYDFRHFLAEAREKATHEAAHARSRTTIAANRTPIPGGKMPIPGSRTPLPGLSSPAVGANRATPQFHATSGSSMKKRKADRPTHTPKPQPASRKHASSDPKRTTPLSSERIIDSDEEADPSVMKPLPISNHRKQLSTLNEGPDQQSSPHLIVSDADAELEIDLGSPPPPSQYTQRKRPHVNPNAFHHNRSQVNTPRIEEDVEMTDADVEELELGSPRSGPSRGMSVSTHVGRIEKSDDVEVEVEEDDDGLAAELEAALEEEAEEETEGLGLGITAGREDESEVSEEE